MNFLIHVNFFILLKVFEVDYFKNIMHYIFISENYLHSNHSLFYTEYTVILTFLFVVVLAFIRLKTIGFIVAIIPSYLMAVTSIRTIT